MPINYDHNVCIIFIFMTAKLPKINRLCVILLKEKRRTIYVFKTSQQYADLGNY